MCGADSFGRRQRWCSFERRIFVQYDLCADIDVDLSIEAVAGWGRNGRASLAFGAQRFSVIFTAALLLSRDLMPEAAHSEANTSAFQIERRLNVSSVNACTTEPGRRCRHLPF
jgi:hypothetical protein